MAILTVTKSTISGEGGRTPFSGLTAFVVVVDGLRVEVAGLRVVVGGFRVVAAGGSMVVVGGSVMVVGGSVVLGSAPLQTSSSTG